MQPSVVIGREVDGLADGLAARIIAVQLRPHVQLPLHAHLRVLVNPARASKEGLYLRQRVERSPRARDDDALGRGDRRGIRRKRRGNIGARLHRGQRQRQACESEDVHHNKIGAKGAADADEALGSLAAPSTPTGTSR